MDTINEITNEIIDFTEIIKNTFPEFYESLDETPLFLSYETNNHKERFIDYTRYLNFLKSQLIEMVKIYELRKHGNDVTQIKSIVTVLINKKQPLLGSNYASLI